MYPFVSANYQDRKLKIDNSTCDGNIVQIIGATSRFIIYGLRGYPLADCSFLTKGTFNYDPINIPMLCLIKQIR